MSEPTDVLVTEGWPSKALVVRARLQIDLEDIVQADITSISYVTYDKFAGTIIGSASLSVAACIFDTVQADSRGAYNFKGRLIASMFPTALTEYRVVITFTPSDSAVDPFDLVVDHTTLEETPPISHS